MENNSKIQSVEIWNCTLILSSEIRGICEEFSKGMNSYAVDGTIHGRYFMLFCIVLICVYFLNCRNITTM
jgi:hypothetical protein